MKLFKKLNARGFSHHFLMMFVVVAVGVGGAYYLVGSHADSITSNQKSQLNSLCQSVHRAVSNGGVNNPPDQKLQDCKDELLAQAQKANDQAITLPGSVMQAADQDACSSEVTWLKNNKPNQYNSLKGTLDNEVLNCNNSAQQIDSQIGIAASKYVGHVVASCSSIAASAHNDSNDGDQVQVSVTLSGGPLTSPVTLGPRQVSGQGGTAGTNTYTWNAAQMPTAVTGDTIANGTITVTEHVFENGTAASNEVQFTATSGYSKTASITEPCAAAAPITPPSGGSIDGNNTSQAVNDYIKNVDIPCLTNHSTAADYTACENACSTKAAQLSADVPNGAAEQSSLNGACGITYTCAIQKVQPSYDPGSGIDCSQGYQAALDQYDKNLNGNIQLFQPQGAAFQTCTTSADTCENCTANSCALKACTPSWSSVSASNPSGNVLYPVPCSNKPGPYVLGIGVWWKGYLVGFTGFPLYTQDQYNWLASVGGAANVCNLASSAKKAPNGSYSVVANTTIPCQYSNGKVYSKNGNGPQGIPNSPLIHGSINGSNNPVNCNANAHPNTNNVCVCNTGYETTDNDNANGPQCSRAREDCNPNASSVTGVCKCNSGFNVTGSNGSGVICTKPGCNPNATMTGTTCNCNTGYTPNGSDAQGVKCAKINCNLHASPTSSGTSCACDGGYQPSGDADEQGVKCVKEVACPGATSYSFEGRCVDLPPHTPACPKEGANPKTCKCPDGTHDNASMSKCVPDTICNISGANSSCVCPPDTTLNAAGNKCTSAVLCGNPHTEVKNGVCTCSTGYQDSGAKNTLGLECVTPPTCTITGQTPVGGQCKCPTGQTVVGSACSGSGTTPPSSAGCNLNATKNSIGVCACNLPNYQDNGQPNQQGVQCVLIATCTRITGQTSVHGSCQCPGGEQVSQDGKKCIVQKVTLPASEWSLVSHAVVVKDGSTNVIRITNPGVASLNRSHLLETFLGADAGKTVQICPTAKSSRNSTLQLTLTKIVDGIPSYGRHINLSSVYSTNCQKFTIDPQYKTNSSFLLVSNTNGSPIFLRDVTLTAQ
ncbi:MAG TPA: hypothetical protein VG604_00495 [Candidatus Saccharimonadales bacterium]|nr:hypothetical protein [Candidatus Saccharimonadales bacterium]